MASSMESDLWDACRRLAQALRGPSCPAPVRLTMHLAGGEALTVHAPPRHSPDFRSVLWEGQPHTFTAAQAAIVKLLWEALDNGTPEVSQAYLTTEANLDTPKLAAVFHSKDGPHPAWGTMITAGESKGTYRLAVASVTTTPADDEEDTADDE